jgi:hypothetical protein
LIALSNELAGKYYLKQNIVAKAQPFLEEALDYYKRWGATAKSSHLEAEIKILA